MNTKIIYFLLLFSASLTAQSYDSYFTGSPIDKMVAPQEKLTVVMGGAQETDVSMVQFLESANGGDILVLRASGSDGYNNYLFSELGVQVNSVETIVFNNKSASSEAYVLDRISKAEAIWFAGGNQAVYLDYWENTEVQAIINDRRESNGISLGGTSAGMAILGNYIFTAENGTITSEEALNNPYASSLTLQASPFINTSWSNIVIFDTHFDNPDRRGRMASFLARIVKDHGVNAIGIGLDEYTAAVIENDGMVTIQSDYPEELDYAYLIVPNCYTTQEPDVCLENQPLTWSSSPLHAVRFKGDTGSSIQFHIEDLTVESNSNIIYEKWPIVNGVLTTETIDEDIYFDDCILSSLQNIPIDESLQHDPIILNNQIQVTNTLDFEMQLWIFDMHGKILINSEPFTFNESKSLELPSLTKGMYQIHYKVNNAFYHSKFIKL